MAVLLLIIEFMVFAFGFFYIFSRDRLFGVYYLILYIYAIFAQIGYFYFPEISMSSNVYFGERVWYEAAIFITLSLVTFLGLFIFLRRHFLRLIPFSLTLKPRSTKSISWLSISFVLSIIAFEIFFICSNFNDISWYTAQDESFVSANPLFGIFIFAFKFMVAINFVLYCLIRKKIVSLPKKLAVTLLAISLGTFIFIAFRLGDRTDVLGLALGIAIYEFYQMRFTWKAIVKLTLISAALFVLLSTIETLRYTNGGTSSDLTTSILVKDYYMPAHMLFAAMSFSYINPVEVFNSNTCNSLILLKYPYLQSTITDLFQPGISTRSASYAFYSLTEGYVVLGDFGFIYNAVMMMLGLSLWKRLATSNNKTFNLFAIGLMGSVLFGLVRGQSSYYVKLLYTYAVPGILLYTRLAGQNISVHLGWRKNIPIQTQNQIP